MEPIFAAAIVASSVIGLMALGFTLQFITLKVPNLAHTTICFSSAYMPLSFWLFGVNPYLALPLSFLIGSLLSWFLYKFLAFLRTRGTGPVGQMMSSLAFGLIIYGIMNIYADYLSYVLKAWARTFTLANADITFFGEPGIVFLAPILLVSLTTFFHLILTRTKFGIAIRAIVQDYSLAATLGVNTDRALGLAWFIVGGIGGLAGAVWPFWFSVDPWTGPRMLSDIFAACVVGGLFSVYGSILGGIIVGGMEILLLWGIALNVGVWVTSYRPIIPVVIAAITLLIFPKGIMGSIETLREKRRK
ncbi:MAG: branched-chain amino acid ABC transporter permease [Nitrososphaeria archaeon]